jgi:thiamine-monophosphate kinase
VVEAIRVKEFELIQRLAASLPRNDSVITGAGDDCAVLDLGVPGRYVLFKTDAVVEGVHFTSETAPEKVGHKALGRCLSDIAAMGGTATAALITLALPPKFDVAFVDRAYAGFNDLAKRHGVAIVGGETTTNPERLLISVALLGTVDRAHCIHRAGARAGDAIFVTGQLGGSLAGKHLDFEPRLREGQWLATHFDIHAMIDISDGLAGDLRHILRSSAAGAELLSDSIPISREAKLKARNESSAKPPLLAALTDGEDFELLFTIASGDAVTVLDAWKKQFPTLPLTCIGRVTEGHGLKLRDKNGLREIALHGYEHFSGPQSQ